MGDSDGAGPERSGSASDEEREPASTAPSESGQGPPEGAGPPSPVGGGGCDGDGGGNLEGRGAGTLHALRRAIWAAQSVADECGVRRGLGVLVRELLRELGRVPDAGLRLRATSLFVDSGLFAGPAESPGDVLPGLQVVDSTKMRMVEESHGADEEQAAQSESDGPIPRQERLLEILRSLTEAGSFPSRFLLTRCWPCWPTVGSVSAVTQRSYSC